MIGGYDSGIWRNGDDDYDGWVGQCEPQYSGCAEFQDRLDFDDDEFYGETDGESYYFIDNSSLDESNLLASQQCNGQVSQKLGCALFNDTSDTGTDYNSSASYISSARADELHGDRAFALVNPIDCDSSATSTIITPSGEEIDLCTRRCSWYKGDLESDFDISTATSIDDIWEFGGSCYDDSDCADYESDTGDLVEGNCSEEVSIGTGTDDVERLDNDSNRVLKVTRDRTCSEWLACSSSYTIWDGDAGKYRTICDGIDLCTKYGGSSSASLCSEWDPDDPAVVFDIDRYVGRDVSWYGEEYAGYAVPDIFPIQHLTQVDIAPPVGFCNMSEDYEEGTSSYDDYHGEICDDDSDCGGTTGKYEYCVVEQDDEYQIGYSAGGCSEDHAEDCVVGYCEASGSACSQDDDCEDTDDECITGVCYEISTTTCEDDDDCSSTQECQAGSCVEETGNCDLDFTCDDSASTCFSSAATKTGSCYSGTCFLAINGNQFDDEVTEDAVCRAQPEVDSPFPTDVVDEWSYLAYGTRGSTSESSADTTVDLETEAIEDDFTLDDISGEDDVVGTDNYYGGMLPADFKAGFGGSETCAIGEACECAYKRVSGRNSDDQFIAYSTDLESIRIEGVCSADSPVAGALCGDDDDCRYYDESLVIGGEYDSSTGDGYIGNCEPIVMEQDYLGLEGYCLERDTGLNVNGDPDIGACLTWFPVDQISGATDLYAKYKSAGYFEDVYVCTNVRPFVTLKTSNIAGDTVKDGSGEDAGIACAESEDGVGQGDSYDLLAGTDGKDGCYNRMYCPDGYFAVGGQPNPKDSWDYGYAADCNEGGDNDCPYICVPENSTHSDGTECGTPQDHGWAGAQTEKTSDWGNTVYTWAEGTGDAGDKEDWQTRLEKFQEVADDYKDCTLEGVEWSEVEDALSDYDYSSEGSGRSDACEYSSSGSGKSGGYRCLWINWEVYPGCAEIMKVSNTTESYAYTDTLYDGQISSSSVFGYSNDTSPAFGFLTTEPSEVSENTPIVVPGCTDDAYGATTVVTSDSFWKSDGNQFEHPASIASCSDSTYADELANLSTYQNPAGNPQARSYVEFYWGGLTAGPYDWETSSKETMFELVNNLFGKLNIDGDNIFTWDDDDWDSTSVDEDDKVDFFSYSKAEWGDDDTYEADYADEIDVREAVGNAPTVWSVDTDNCGTKYCREGEENGVTINNTNEGDIEADGGYFRATMKFFAAADKNQLPIRRVIVEWGDGSHSGSDDESNYYKNHRGLQDGEDGGSDETTTLSKCDLGTAWGLTSATCDPNEFNYSHVYRCWDPTELPTCVEDDSGDLTNSPCTFDQLTCVFQPRVHVRDNWGFCSGECDSTDSGINADGDSECFDSYGDIETSNPNSECNYSKYPDADESTNPWVYYDGYIYVDP